MPFNNTRTLKLKTQLIIAFFAAVNHNYDDKQLEPTDREKKKQTKGIEIYQSQPTDVNFWTCWSEPLFPETSAKMIDGSEKRNR